MSANLYDPSLDNQRGDTKEQRRAKTAGSTASSNSTSNSSSRHSGNHNSHSSKSSNSSNSGNGGNDCSPHDIKAFIEAVQKLDCDKVEDLLNQHEDLLKKAKPSCDSILIAAFPTVGCLNFKHSKEKETSILRMVKLLVTRAPALTNKRSKIAEHYPEKLTPLHCAIEYGLIEVAKFLFSMGARIGIRRESNNNYDNYIFMTEQIAINHFCSLAKDNSIANRYQEFREYITVADGIHFNAESNKLEKLKAVLNQYPELLHIKSAEGYTLLFSALKQKIYPQDTALLLFECLFKQGLAYKKDSNGRTVFQYAVQYEQWQFIVDAFQLQLKFTPAKEREQRQAELIAELDLLVQSAREQQQDIDYFVLGQFNPQYLLDFAIKFQKKTEQRAEYLKKKAAKPKPPARKPRITESEDEEYDYPMGVFDFDSLGSPNEADKKHYTELVSKGIIKVTKREDKVHFELSLENRDKKQAKDLERSSSSKADKVDKADKADSKTDSKPASKSSSSSSAAGNSALAETRKRKRNDNDSDADLLFQFKQTGSQSASRMPVGRNSRPKI